MTALRLCLLGGFELKASRAMANTPRKVKALLAYLALSPDVPHARDKLATLLWETSGEGQARQSLRQALVDLRKALPAADNILHCTHETVTLGAAAIEVDVLELKRLYDRATPEAFEQAAGLYRGELLDGLNSRAPAFEDWLALEATRVREQALGAMTQLLDHCLATGAIEPGVQWALHLLALDPLRESAHRALMQLYARQGRYGSALKQYDNCRRVLACDLGVAPEAATTALYKELAQGRKGPPPTSSAKAEALGAPRRIPAESGDPEDHNLLGNFQSVESNTELVPVTVLSVRIADFATVTKRLDPEALRQCLNRYYDVIDGETRRHGGVITKHANEVVVSVFGLPGVVGNDVARALRAAGAIHRTIAPPLSVQIGIASGKVLNDQVGSAHHRETAIIGNCVTLAAELAQTAAAKATIVTDEAYQSVAAHFDGFLVPTKTVAGVRAWELGAERRSVPPPLVGRHHERRVFESALDACQATGGGQCFLVRGEAGIGKTRLIEEFERLARARGFATYKALVLDFGTGVSQDAVRALARSLLGLPWTSGAQLTEQAAEQAIATGLLERSQYIFLSDLLGLSLPVHLKAAYDAMDSGAREDGKQAMLKCLIEASAARRPMLLAVEDIHWADTATLIQLAHIAGTIGGCAALLVMSERSETEPLDPAWHGAMHGAPLTTLDLGPLRGAEATELATYWSGGSGEIIQRYVERAGGNPFFLEQLLRTSGAGSSPIPHSVQSLVCARLDRLPAEDKHAVRAAAVIGQRFSLPLLHHLLGDPHYVGDRLLEQHLIRPWGEQYLFTHALIAESIYDALAVSERRRLHRAAADWFSGHDAVLVAEHLDRADDPGAARAYLDAAKLQAGVYRNGDALRLAQRGLALNPDALTWHELTCLEAELLQESGAIDASLAAYERACQRAVAPSERCRAWIGIAAGLRVQDRYGEALHCLERAERVATRAEEFALIHFHRGNVMVPLGRTADCLEAHELALRYSREAASALLEARALSGLGDAHYLLGRMRTAYEQFARCIGLCRAHGFGHIEVANLAMRGATRFYAMEVEAAIEDALAAADLAIRVVNRRAESIARNVLAYLLYYAADYDATRREAEQGLVLARSLGSKRFEIKSLLNLGIARAGLGQSEGAEQALSDAYAIGERSGMGLWAPWVLGALALATNDAGKRRWALGEGENLLAQGSVGHNYLHFYELAMEAAIVHGDWQDAGRYAGLLEGYTHIEALPWSDFCVARARALARCGKEGRAGSESLQRLIDEARQTGLKQSLPALEEALNSARI